MNNKPFDNRAWFFVLPVFVLVAISAIIPLMTVVNYSVQDTFGNNQFFWAGTEWFTEILESERFRASLVRNLVFSAIILCIEIPLGIAIALAMPRKGMWGVSVPGSDGAAATHSVERSWHNLAGIRPYRHWTDGARTNLNRH